MLRSRFLWKLFAGMVALVVSVGGSLSLISLSALQVERTGLAQRVLEDKAQTALLLLAQPVARSSDAQLVDSSVEYDPASEVGAAQQVGLRGKRQSQGQEQGQETSEEPVAQRLLTVARLLLVDLEWLDGEGRRVAIAIAPSTSPLSHGDRRLTTSASLEAIGQVGTLKVTGDPSPRGLGARTLLTWIPLVLCLGLLGSLIFARGITAPIRSVALAADDLTHGRYGSRLTVRSRDEIGTLAMAFNDARDRLVAQLDTMTGDRDQLDAILDSLTEGVLAVDGDEKVLHVNDVALDLLERHEPAASFSGKPVLTLTRDPHILHALSETLEGAGTWHQTYTRGEGAAERVLEVSTATLRNRGQSGVNQGAVLVLHDITRLQRLEGIRRDFVSNVSHELKTPLTVIRGFVETMIDSDDLDLATRRRFLSRIQLQTQRLSELVSDLLSLSRIESTRDTAAASVLDARQAVGETLQALRPLLEERRIDLETELADSVVSVRAERESLLEAFSNLVGNAVKYSPEGGRVVVRLCSDAEFAVFEVEDSGPGIALEHRHRIFERFYRVDKARSREVGGTGLGLAIVKNVATSLGGTVEVESEVGHGSLFRMRIPLDSVEGVDDGLAAETHRVGRGAG